MMLMLVLLTQYMILAIGKITMRQMNTVGSSLEVDKWAKTC